MTLLAISDHAHIPMSFTIEDDISWRNTARTYGLEIANLATEGSHP